jgi:hypothetical protein
LTDCVLRYLQTDNGWWRVFDRQCAGSRSFFPPMQPASQPRIRDSCLPRCNTDDNDNLPIDGDLARGLRFTGKQHATSATVGIDQGWHVNNYKLI